MRLVRSILPAMFAGVLLAACGDAPKDQATLADKTAADDAPLPPKKEGGLFGFLGGDKPADADAPAPDLGEFKITSVSLGNSLDKENNVVAAKQAFATSDTIHAVVLSTGKHAGLTLSAKWNTADGALVAESAQALVPTSPTYTAFTVKNPAGWPPGKYQVAIAVNGHVLQTRTFDIAADAVK